MPTYVYECSKCHTTFEAMQRITEEPLDTCECGSKGTVKRVIQPIAVMFKGSGFHINDYSAPTESKAEIGSTTAAKTETPSTAPEPSPPSPSPFSSEKGEGA